jgi:hypothetical protein
MSKHDFTAADADQLLEDWGNKRSQARSGMQERRAEWDVIRPLLVRAPG